MKPAGKVIAELAYAKVDKFIEFNEQKTVRKEHRLLLCENKILAEKGEFAIEDLWDISYRPFSDGAGLLYLHTVQGLFAFEVDTSPADFIENVRKRLQS